MKFFKLFLAVILAAAAAVAQVGGGTLKTVTSDGFGATQQGAVAAAIEQVLTSTCGMSVSLSKAMSVNSSDTSVTGTAGDADKASSEESFQKQIMTKAQGRIAGYTVMGSAYDAAAKQWRATVAVSVHGRYIVGRDPNNLRRMAVADFKPRKEEFVIYGKSFPGANISQRLSAKLTDCLTQTRKFTMLERTFDGDVQNEMARLSDPNASPEDNGRLCQKLATDYLVVGMIDVFDVPQGVKNPYSGITTTTPATIMEVQYRVILVPTSQLKWSGTVKLSSDEVFGRSLDEYVSSVMERAAQKIADAIMDNILPFNIVGRAGAEVVIGQGGNTIEAGEDLEVFSSGEMMKDDRTGEELGRVEALIGHIRITRVTPKMAYASVLDGDINAMVKGTVVRRHTGPVQQQQQAPADPTQQTTIQVTPNGGVVPPFKQ